MAALGGAGLHPDAMWRWLASHNHSHSVPVFDEEFSMMLLWTPINAMPRHTPEVIAEAQRWAAASAAERRIAAGFLLCMEDVTELTEGDPAQIAATVGIADLLRTRLGKNGHVIEAVQKRMPEYNGQTLLEVIDLGWSARALADLRDGLIDPTDDGLEGGGPFVRRRDRR